MDFDVGMILGENYYFSANHSWPAVKLTIEPEKIILATGFKSHHFDKDQITRLAPYAGFCWIFAQGIRIEHTNPDIPKFIVFWAFDLTEIKSTLAENDLTLTEGDDWADRLKPPFAS
jgi:hypothetical protein